MGKPGVRVPQRIDLGLRNFGDRWGLILALMDVPGEAPFFREQAFKTNSDLAGSQGADGVYGRLHYKIYE